MCAIECIERVGKKRSNSRLLSILIFFCNEFNKSNNREAQMLDSIYHRTLKVLTNRIF